MLTVQGVNVALGERPLLDDVSFQIASGEKVGLVGVNGAGKSTLLKIIAGQQLPDKGSVVASASVGYLPQEPRAAFRPDQTTIDCLFQEAGLLDLNREIEVTARGLGQAINGSPEQAILLARYGQLQHDWEHRGGYDAEPLARRLLDGLGLGRVGLDQPFSTLSGGQKSRLALAALLFRRPEFLLLDEPTNHLDRGAAAWLMDFLASFSGAVLVVSHDLVLLDKAITRVIRIDEQIGRVEIYRGNYSAYRKQWEARKAQAEKQARLANREISQLQVTADRFRAGTRSVQARQLERRIERLKATTPRATVESKAPTLKTLAPPPSARVVLEATDLWKAYGANIVLAGVNFTLERGQKLALIGPNGAGKTTLLKAISGSLPLDDGQVRPGLNVRLGYYAQEHEALNPSSTVLEEAKHSAAIGQPVPPPPDGVVRSFLGSFLFSGSKVLQQVGTLSGGERTRLALAKLFLEKANLLLLDEPTNNLDPASQEALLKVLSAFTGTLIIVGHQADFMERLAPDRALILPEGQVAEFDPALLLPETKRSRNGRTPSGAPAPAAVGSGRGGRR